MSGTLLASCAQRLQRIEFRRTGVDRCGIGVCKKVLRWFWLGVGEYVVCN